MLDQAPCGPAVPCLSRQARAAVMVRLRGEADAGHRSAVSGQRSPVKQVIGRQCHSGVSVIRVNTGMENSGNFSFRTRLSYFSKYFGKSTFAPIGPSPALGHLPLPLSPRSLSPILAAAYMPPRVEGLYSLYRKQKKGRKKTGNPREGWEDGTPPPHRDFKERGVVRKPSPTLGRPPLPISLRILSPILAATFVPPRGRPLQCLEREA